MREGGRGPDLGMEQSRNGPDSNSTDQIVT